MNVFLNFKLEFGISFINAFTEQVRIFTTVREKPFENTAGKGENAGNQHFLLFPQCFLPYQRKIAPVEPH